MSGGAERVLCDVTRELYNRGHRITVLTHEERNGPSFHPLNFGIERIDTWPRHSRRRKRPPLDRVRKLGEHSLLLALPIWVVQFAPKILRLRRALRRAEPDAVVGFMPTMFPYTTIAALGLKTRTVVSVHNVPAREFGNDRRRWSQNRFDIRVRRLSLRLADAVTVLLPSFKKQFRRRGVRGKTYIIPNMIRAARDLPASVRTSGQGNTILAVGRLAEAKDHRSLIEAWAMIEDKYPDWNVKIIGDGPLKRSLSRRIRHLGLQRLKLAKPTREIMAEYRKAKFLAMPSSHEGFGLATAEALSAGLPVVGFRNCPGTNELISHGWNGLLADPRGGRARGLQVELEKMIRDEPLRLTLAANAPASVAEFSPAAIADQWEQMLLSVTKGGKAYD